MSDLAVLAGPFASSPALHGTVVLASNPMANASLELSVQHLEPGAQSAAGLRYSSYGVPPSGLTDGAGPSGAAGGEELPPARIIVEQPDGTLDVGSDPDRVPKPMPRPRRSSDGSGAASVDSEQERLIMEGTPRALCCAGGRYGGVHRAAWLHHMARVCCGHCFNPPPWRSSVGLSSFLLAWPTAALLRGDALAAPAALPVMLPHAFSTR